MMKIIAAMQWGGKTADSWIRLVLKRSRDGLLVLADTLACVEIELQVLVRAGVFDLDLPSYSLKLAEPFWQDMHPDFGNWHPTNARYRHHRSCFDLIHSGNAHGRCEP